MTTVDKLTEAANALSTAVQSLRDADHNATATASDVIHDLIRDIASLKHRTRRLADTIRLDGVAEVKVEVAGGVTSATQCPAGVNACNGINPEAVPDLLAALELDHTFYARALCYSSLPEFRAAGYTGTEDGCEMRRWLNSLKDAAIIKAKGSL